MPRTRQVRTEDGLSLATEAFGAEGDPATVLIMGATASMLGWPDALCAAVAAEGRFVLRFDHRDTGRSTTWPPGPPAYSVEDMAADVLTVMDGWSVARADLVGMSLGGYIAQIVALLAPDRVHSLTLLSSEPLGWEGEPLPGILPDFLDHFGKFAKLDWQDRAAVTAMMLESARLCAVDPAHVDVAAERARIEQVLDRTDSPQSAYNHGMVSLAGDWTGMARKIACPVLVLHGERDPILPLPNAEALAREIPGASLSIIPGLGHALPAPFIPAITRRIARFWTDSAVQDARSRGVPQWRSSLP